MTEWFDWIKATALDLLRGGEELQPVLFAQGIDYGVSVVPLSHLDKEVWPTVAAEVVRDTRARAVAMVSSAWTVEVARDALPPTVLPSQHPKRESIGILHVVWGDGGRRYFEIKYECVGSTDQGPGRVVHFGRWREVPDGVVVDRVLDGAFS